MKGRGGFTLIELMIVVAVIGILAAVAIPKFAEMIRKSKEGSTKGNLGAIRSALAVYYSDMEGNYPLDLSGLQAKYLKNIPSLNTTPYHGELSSYEYIQGAANSNDQGDWGYDNNNVDLAFGTVWVNCTHTDGRGVLWSTY